MRIETSDKKDDGPWASIATSLLAPIPQLALSRWIAAAAVAPLAAVPAFAQTLNLQPSQNRPTQTAPADGSPVIPDRRLDTQPNVQLGGLSLNRTGAQYRSDSQDSRLSASLGTSRRIGIDYAHLLGDQWAVGANISAGTKHREIMLNGLYSPSKNLHVGLSLGWLRDTDTYQFYSGPNDVAVKQTSALLRAIKRFDEGSWLTQLNASVYTARARKPDVPDAVMVEETPTLIRFLVDPREISPGRLLGFNAGIGFSPWANAEMKLSLGRETLRYRFQDGSGETNSRTATGLGYTHTLPGCWQLEGNYNTGVAGDRISLGVRHGIWNMGVARDAGVAGMKARTSLVVGLEIPLGGGERARCAASVGTRQTQEVRRLDEVFQRPRELPSRVLAKVDMTAVPVLLASLDKAGLGGATVSATPEELIIRLPVGALTVAQVDLNGAPSSNTGSNGSPLVWTQDGAIHIGIRRFPNPGAGVSTPVSVVVVMADASLTLLNFNTVGF